MAILQISLGVNLTEMKIISFPQSYWFYANSYFFIDQLYLIQLSVMILEPDSSRNLQQLVEMAEMRAKEPKCVQAVGLC